MKVAPGGQSVVIQCTCKYSLDELFEIMRSGGIEEKFGPIELKKGFLDKNILVPGLKGFTNEVSTSGKGIVIMQQKRKSLGKATLLNVATFGIAGKIDDIKGASHLLGLGGAKDNKEVMKALTEEIEKLVEVK